MKRVGFIGLGLMGAPMAANVARAGYPLTVYNRSPEKTASLNEVGARSAATPREVAAASDVVITMLTDAAAVEQVLRGDEGLLAGGRSGSVLIDMSTVSPDQSRSMAIEVEVQGWRKLEAPVYGSTGPARDGTLGIMVGGDPSLFEEQRDLLQTMGRSIFYMGRMGAGAATKLAFNLMVASQFQSLAEAMALAGSAGVDLGKLSEVIQATAVSSDLIRRKIANILGDNYAPAFPLKHMHKDLGLMLETGHALGVPLPATGAIHESFTAARSRGYGDLDAIAVFCLLAELSGSRAKP
ncbi:MAG TPA: NAD(P)-dependent oxidoreductase [Anaerolineales bacterium]|nr:NAD(P)-dependent oxidoreductase [Anaerolineales bacterium]